MWKWFGLGAFVLAFFAVAAYFGSRMPTPAQAAPPRQTAEAVSFSFDRPLYLKSYRPACVSRNDLEAVLQGGPGQCVRHNGGARVVLSGDAGMMDAAVQVRFTDGNGADLWVSVDDLANSPAG